MIHHEHVSTRVNGVRHSKYFLKAQKAFPAQVGIEAAGKRYTREIGWHSMFNFPTGYAISSRELAAALDRHGVHVAYKYVYGPARCSPARSRNDPGRYLVDVIRASSWMTAGSRWSMGRGMFFTRTSDGTGSVSRCWRPDHIPAEWARQANLMDEVWCLLRFNAATFRASGVERPIHVIPLGVDPRYFNPRMTAHRVGGVFTFLSIFEWGERKAPEMLLKAFNEEFLASEPVILIAKVLNVDPRSGRQGQCRGARPSTRAAAASTFP